MGAANSYISRRLPTLKKRNRVHELKPGALLANSTRNGEANSKPVLSSDSPPVATPLIPPKIRDDAAPAVINLPGKIEEEVAMPSTQQQALQSDCPAVNWPPLEKMVILKKRPRKLPPLSIHVAGKVWPSKKLNKLPPLPPIAYKEVFAVPDPVLQDIEDEDIQFGNYQRCRQSQSGNAISFDLVFSDSKPKGGKPSLQQRPKTAKSKLKKQIKKKMKAADKRKAVSEHFHCRCNQNAQHTFTCSVLSILLQCRSYSNKEQRHSAAGMLQSPKRC